jgi:hypothetical protein
LVGTNVERREKSPTTIQELQNKSAAIVRPMDERLKMQQFLKGRHD